MEKFMVLIMAFGLINVFIPNPANAATVAYINNYPSDYWGYSNAYPPGWLDGISSIESYQVFSTRGAAAGVQYLGSPYNASTIGSYDVVILDAWDGTGMNDDLEAMVLDYLNYYNGKLIITVRAYYYLGTTGPLLSDTDFPISGSVGAAFSSTCSQHNLDTENSNMDHPILEGVADLREYGRVSSFYPSNLKPDSELIAMYYFIYAADQPAIVLNSKKNIVFINHQARESCYGNAETVFDNTINFLTAEPDIDVGTAGITIDKTDGATAIVDIDDDSSDGIVGAAVGSDAYAYGSGVSPFDDTEQATVDGSIPFTVNEVQDLYLLVSVGGILGGYQLFNSGIEVSAHIEDAEGNIIAQFPGIDRSISTRPIPNGFEQVERTESVPYTADPLEEYVLVFHQKVQAWATGAGSVGYANFKGSTNISLSTIPLDDFPVADAGEDQVIVLGDSIYLNGLSSHDPQSMPLTYSWKQIGGPPVSITGANGPEPSCTPTEAGLYSFELVVNNGEIASYPDYVNIMVEEATTEIVVDIDVKPGSYPNCFNINGHGVVPVAILGSETFDVASIDTSTLFFGGLSVRARGKNGIMCHMEDVSGDYTFPEGTPDGYVDLVCQFADDAGAWASGENEAELTGALLPENGETPITGSDSICIKPDKNDGLSD